MADFRLGWVKLHRKIRDHWLWPKGCDRYSKFEAWLDLLLSANHSQNKVPIGSRLITVARGQVLTSQLSLAKRWGWNRKTVNAFLKLTKSDEILDFESSKEVDTGYTLITIRNYNRYQDKEKEPLDIETDNEGDFQGTTKGQRRDTNKNVKNDKKEDMGESLRPRPDPAKKQAVGNGSSPEPDKYAVEFDEVKAIYPRRDGDQRWKEALGHYRAARKGGESMEVIMDGVRRYHAWCDRKGLIRTDKVKQAATFMGREQCWRESWEIPKAAAGGFVG